MCVVIIIAKTALAKVRAFFSPLEYVSLHGKKMGRILTSTASGTLIRLALTLTLQTDRHSKVATNIPELRNGHTFQRCRIDG